MTDTAAQLRADMLPDNDDAYWEPADLDTFIELWQDADLPAIAWYDASGAHLGIAVTHPDDLTLCARTLGLPIDDDGQGFGWDSNGYDVRVEVNR